MRLIDADALIEFVKCDSSCGWHDVGFTEYLVGNQPTVDAEPVVHGKWLLHSTYNPCDSHQCSVCGIILSEWSADMKGLSYYRNFCPRCGARMNGFEIKQLSPTSRKGEN